jgi:hypothetical protein
MLWIILFTSISALTLYAARYWKIPEYGARHYWASRLTGSSQAFLGSDDRWHYFALKGMFFHGWQVGRVPRELATSGRDAGVRAHIDELILSEQDRVAELQEFTGLGIETHDAWVAWWRHNRRSWDWPVEQEQLWEARAVSRWAECPESMTHRAWYMEEIGKVRSKAMLEILFFGGFLLLVWPVGPWAIRALWVRCDYQGVILASSIAATAALVLYTAAAFPHIQWHYGLGASTTLSGPGFFSFSGPYPFRLQYKPGDTILYRQFLELVCDPAVRLADAGLLRWLPRVPLFLVAPIPYLAVSLIIGAFIGLRSRRALA